MSEDNDLTPTPRVEVPNPEDVIYWHAIRGNDHGVLSRKQLDNWLDHLQADRGYNDIEANYIKATGWSRNR